MTSSCNEEMVRAHTASLASHGARIKDLAQRLTDVNTRINEVASLVSQLAGNGRRGAIDNLRDEIHSLAMAMAQDTSEANGRARSAHRRLDEFIPAVADNIKLLREDVDRKVSRMYAWQFALILAIIGALLGAIKFGGGI